MERKDRLSHLTPSLFANAASYLTLSKILLLSRVSSRIRILANSDPVWRHFLVSFPSNSQTEASNSNNSNALQQNEVKQSTQKPDDEQGKSARLHPPNSSFAYRQHFLSNYAHRKRQYWLVDASVQMKRAGIKLKEKFPTVEAYMNVLRVLKREGVQLYALGLLGLSESELVIREEDAQQAERTLEDTIDRTYKARRILLHPRFEEFPLSTETVLCYSDNCKIANPYSDAIFPLLKAGWLTTTDLDSKMLAHVLDCLSVLNNPTAVLECSLPPVAELFHWRRMHDRQCVYKLLTPLGIMAVRRRFITAKDALNPDKQEEMRKARVAVFDQVWCELNPGQVLEHKHREFAMEHQGQQQYRLSADTGLRNLVSAENWDPEDLDWPRVTLTSDQVTETSVVVFRGTLDFEWRQRTSKAEDPFAHLYSAFLARWHDPARDIFEEVRGEFDNEDS